MPPTPSKFRDPATEVALTRMLDVDVLACTLYGEARGSGEEAIIAVGQSIMNRVDDGRYGEGLAAVCLRRLQYSCWWERNANGNATIEIARITLDDGRFWTVGEEKHMNPILVLVPGIVNGSFAPKVPDCLHYHTVSDKTPERWPWWAKGKAPAVVIGSFKFYDNIDPPKKRG